MQDEYSELLETLLYDGLRVKHLKLAAFEETGRGLAATAEVRPGETLMTIPIRHLLNLKNAGKELGLDWKSSALPAHVALALYIIIQRRRGRESHLKAYIDSLPTSFATFPMTWPEEVVARLPASVQLYISKQKTVYRRHHELASMHVKNHPEHFSSIKGPGFDAETFEWAWTMVNSRCIYQALSGTSSRDDNYACAPLIDMINHVPSAKEHCKLSYDIKGLSVVSNSWYKTGDEVFISYGAHSNEALLCEYGFVIPHGNSDNCLFLDEAVKALLQSYHVSLLMEIDYYEDYTLDWDGWPSFRTEVALRVALLAEEECEEDAQGYRRLMQFINGHSSGRTEEAAMRRLLERLLREELSAADEQIARCVDVKDSSLPNFIRPFIVQVWTDRRDLARIGLDNLQDAR